MTKVEYLETLADFSPRFNARRVLLHGFYNFLHPVIKFMSAMFSMNLAAVQITHGCQTKQTPFCKLV